MLSNPSYYEWKRCYRNCGNWKWKNFGIFITNVETCSRLTSVRSNLYYNTKDFIKNIFYKIKKKDGDGPIGLVFAPTRELANQIHKQFKLFGKPLGINSVCAYGGAGIGG